MTSECVSKQHTSFCCVGNSYIRVRGFKAVGTIHCLEGIAELQYGLKICDACNPSKKAALKLQVMTIINNPNGEFGALSIYSCSDIQQD